MSKVGKNKISATQENILIGNRLRLAREKAGLTKAEVAKLLGVEASRVINLEFGRRGMQSGTLLRVCRAYNISPNEALAFEDIGEDKAKIVNMFNSLNETNKDILITVAKVLLKSEGE